MTCRYCATEKATTEVHPEFTVHVDAPKCAFIGPVFSPDNWNCGTMNRLRDMAEKREPKWTEDQSAATIPHDGRFLILGWYKSRGRTEFASLLSESDISPLWLADAYELIEVLS